jgi:AcrR family transcriptional regulator
MSSIETESKSRHDLISEFRCSQILEAARKIFSEKGFRDATMDEIAAAAGVAKGTLYSYFPSKRDVYLAELSRGGAEMLALARQAMAGPGDCRWKLEEYIRTRVEYLNSHLEFFRIYHSEFGKLTHPAWVSEEFRRTYSEQLHLLVDLLQTAVARGEIRPVDVETVACGVYEMTRGLLLKRVVGGSTGSVASEAASITELLWRGIRSE